MGVDYSANFGIGVELQNIEFPEYSDTYDGPTNMYEYLEGLPQSDSVSIMYFESGDGVYTGKDRTFYLCFRKPLDGGVESLKNKIKVFKKYLKENNIKYFGEIDLVGGLHIS